MICYVPRSLLQILHFSRPVKRSQFTFTRPIPMLLRLISQQYSTANRKKRSSSSSVRTGTSSHGSRLTCRVYPGDWLSTVCESTRKQNLLKSISVGSPRRREAIGEEVARLLAAEFIREIYHFEWLANVVMVPKKDDSLCMCIDFKHINHACPKDHSPLPRIDQIDDSTAGCERLSFWMLIPGTIRSVCMDLMK